MMNAHSRQRHARYYFQRGTDIFAVGGTLYKIHADLLGLRGGVLQDLFELPQSSENREGLTDDQPIQLPQVTEREFEHFLELIYDGHLLPPYSLEKLADILKLSTQWGVDSGRQWAIHHLEASRNVPASLRLQLARRYNVPQWVEPAFRELVFCISLGELRGDDFVHLSYPVYILITKLKEAVEHERRVVAYLAPECKTHGPSCSNPERCSLIWRETWWLKIGRRLLHPDADQSMPLEKGPGAVESLEWAGMSPACRENMVATVARGDGFAGAAEIFKSGLMKLAELAVE
ncbi:hypothetical protein FKP32DRAFT_1756887 [Trametes sanguinea]|nr:hypothetical protein FKP32DRAFT_1756887 [Trametes sanguinea]